MTYTVMTGSDCDNERESVCTCVTERGATGTIVMGERINLHLWDREKSDLCHCNRERVTLVEQGEN